MAYRLVIFDFDGTLGDTLGWVLSILDEITERYGYRHITEDEIALLRTYGPREIIKHLGFPLWKVPMVGAYLRRRMAQEIDRIALYDGIPDALRRLDAAGKQLAVVSSNDEANVRGVLGRELAGLIDTWDCGVSIFGKPARLRKVLRELATPPARAIYIGDEIRDVEAAQEVGMAMGAVTWGYNEAASLAALRPTFVFDSVAEIAEKLVG